MCAGDSDGRLTRRDRVSFLEVTLTWKTVGDGSGCVDSRPQERSSALIRLSFIDLILSGERSHARGTGIGPSSVSAEGMIAKRLWLCTLREAQH